MSVIKHFNSFLYVFFLIGIAPLHSDTKMYLIPVTIATIINVSVTGFSVYYNYYLSELGLVMKIINCTSLLSGLTFCLTANFQCCYFPSIYQNLIFEINKIESSLEKKFSENLPLSSFANSYKLKLVLLFSLLAVSIISAGIELWKLLQIKGIFIGLLQTLTSSYAGLIVAHSVLYIGIVEMFFRVLNRQIENSPAPRYSCKKIEFLKYIKLVHMDLWKVVIQINDFFSWSLLFFTLNYMIYIVYDLYLVFHMLQVERNVLGVSGNIFYG